MMRNKNIGEIGVRSTQEIEKYLKQFWPNTMKCLVCSSSLDGEPKEGCPVCNGKGMVFTTNELVEGTFTFHFWDDHGVPGIPAWLQECPLQIVGRDKGKRRYQITPTGLLVNAKGYNYEAIVNGREESTLLSTFEPVLIEGSVRLFTEGIDWMGRKRYGRKPVYVEYEAHFRQGLLAYIRLVEARGRSYFTSLLDTGNLIPLSRWG